MTERSHVKLLIVGSGPAGYTAAVYASRAMLEPMLIQGMQPGGQLTITTEVENWPGETEIQGPDLMVKMEAHAKAMGAEIVTDLVTSLDLQDRPFTATCDSGRVVTADAVILATEDRLKGVGASACATFDGFLYRNRAVVVIGGGNTAVKEALFLTKFASSVTLIHCGGRLRAEKILQNRIFAHPKVEVICNSELAEVTGIDSPVGVSGVTLRDLRDGSLREIRADGMFLAIGHAPASELVKGQLDLHAGRHVKVEPGSTRTSIPGVFAAGDLTDQIYRQAVTSAGMGCMAALDAAHFLEAQGEVELAPEGLVVGVA